MLVSESMNAQAQNFDAQETATSDNSKRVDTLTAFRDQAKRKQNLLEFIS